MSPGLLLTVLGGGFPLIKNMEAEEVPPREAEEATREPTKATGFGHSVGGWMDGWQLHYIVLLVWVKFSVELINMGSTDLLFKVELTWDHYKKKRFTSSRVSTELC